MARVLIEEHELISCGIDRSVIDILSAKVPDDGVFITRQQILRWLMELPITNLIGNDPEIFELDRQLDDLLDQGVK